jgi:hypothetical protein
MTPAPSLRQYTDNVMRLSAKQEGLYRGLDGRDLLALGTGGR